MWIDVQVNIFSKVLIGIAYLKQTIINIRFVDVLATKARCNLCCGVGLLRYSTWLLHAFL